MESKGIITQIMKPQSGLANGKDWKKVDFVIDTKEKYDNIIAFDIFGEQKVDKFLQDYKVGQEVSVEFNIKCREYKGKYYTNLSAWRVWSNTDTTKEVSKDDDLPF